MPMTLKAYRVNKNLTLEEASELLGITAKTLSNWERGITYPDVPQIGKIEAIYQTSYDDIIFLPATSE